MIRVRTTGGGGWGDPLRRDPALVVRDVVWRKVSPEAALRDYGVVLTGSVDGDDLAHDSDATAAERASRPAPDEAFFDRGPGYATLSGGATHADVDLLVTRPLTLVTGGTRGIGAATALRLAEAGHDLCSATPATTRPPGRPGPDCVERGADCRVVRVDLTAPDGPAALFAAAREAGVVTGVVNNAGATVHIATLAETPVDVVRRSIDLNLTAALLVAREAVLAMGRSRGGRGGVLVNVSSGAATLGSPGEYVHYAAAKARRRRAHDRPGAGGRRRRGPGGRGRARHRRDPDPRGRRRARPVDRVGPLVPLGRAGRPSEVAEAVAWLLSTRRRTSRGRRCGSPAAADASPPGHVVWSPGGPLPLSDPESGFVEVSSCGSPALGFLPAAPRRWSRWGAARDPMTVTDTDLTHLRRCVELAREALDDGDEPFGSVLVDGDGAVRFEDRNRVKDGDQTRHPELEIARWAPGHLTPAERAAATVYTSGEHCAMCSAAHAWVGLGRIVYAVSSAQLIAWRQRVGRRRLAGGAAADRAVAPGVPVDGPAPELEAEMRELHRRRACRPRDEGRVRRLAR